MIVIRNVFIARPGQASKLAIMFKTAAAAGKLPNHRVLNDLTGEFNRVVLEYEVGNLAEFEATMKEYQTNPEARKAMQGYTEMYLSGHREILQTA
jgi:hypothetical protein